MYSMCIINYFYDPRILTFSFLVITFPFLTQTVINSQNLPSTKSYTRGFAQYGVNRPKHTWRTTLTTCTSTFDIIFLLPTSPIIVHERHHEKCSQRKKIQCYICRWFSTCYCNTICSIFKDTITKRAKCSYNLQISVSKICEEWGR